jgi:geranylgeranyl pyrophosphate synthase
MHVVCRAVGPSGMTGGQMLDIVGEGQISKSKVRGAATRILETHLKKTAEFIAAAVVAGAVLGGAPTSDQRKLRRAGLALGMLFQMTDDLLDAEQASEVDRVTMVSAIGRAGAAGRAELQARKSERLFRSLGAAYRNLAGFPGLVLHRRS